MATSNDNAHHSLEGGGSSSSFAGGDGSSSRFAGGSGSSTRPAAVDGLRQWQHSLLFRGQQATDKRPSLQIHFLVDSFRGSGVSESLQFRHSQSLTVRFRVGLAFDIFLWLELLLCFYFTFLDFFLEILGRFAICNIKKILCFRVCVEA